MNEIKQDSPLDSPDYKVWEYRIKCMGCGLHYIVFSDQNEDWGGKPGEGRNGGYCPECGMPGGKVIWGPRLIEGFIFQRVPGDYGSAEAFAEPTPMSMYPAPRLSYGQGAGSKPPRGPYGTNEGDKWLAPDSEMQNELDAKGEGHVLVHEMLVKYGKLEEAVYVTSDPELIEEARQGHELYMAQQASQN